MLFFKYLFFCIISVNLYANSLIVIVSKDSNINDISKKELSKIFLSKTKKLPNGEKSSIIEIYDKNIQSKFYQKICNKNSTQLRRYWTKMIFTGKGQPPKKMKSYKEIIEYVSKNQNAISYIPAEYITSKIQTIMEID